MLTTARWNDAESRLSLSGRHDATLAVSLNEVPTYWLRNLRSSERSRGQQRTARGKALGAERSADCGRKRARQANSRAGLPSEAGVQARYKRLAVTHATT